MTVQLVGIGLKKRNANKKCRISCCMAAEKKHQAAAGEGHDPFFTDRRLYKLFKPHRFHTF